MLSNLFAQQSQLNLHIEAKKIKYVSVDVKDAQGRFCSALRIISTIEGLQYDSYMGIVQIDDLENEDIVFVLPQEQAIELYHQNYEPYRIDFARYGIQLNPKEMWEISISEGSGEISNTAPTQVQITIKTTPALSKYYIDGNYIGVNENFTVTSGQHLLEIKKMGYTTFKKNIYVSQTNNFFQYVLEKEGGVAVNQPPVNYQPQQPAYQPQPQVSSSSTVGSIKIESNPSDAEIYINGNKLPKNSPAVIDNLVFGDYKVELKLSGYSGEISVKLNSPEQKSIFLDLNPLYGKIDVQSQPEGSDIHLDGNMVGKTPMVIENVSKGFHTIKITKNNFETSEDVINISAGATYNYTKSITQLGTLDISSNPDNVKININGEMTYKTPWKGELETGNHNITFTKANYFDKSLNVNLMPGEKKSLNIILDPNMMAINKRISRLKLVRNVCFYTAVASTVTGAVLKFSSDQDYEDYKKAGSDATSLHDTIEMKDQLYPMAIGAGAALLIPSIYSHLKVRQLKSQLNVSYDPVINGHQVKLVYNFK